MDSSEPAKQVLEEAKQIYDDAKTNVLLHGRISDDDFKLDFRFRLGIMYGIEKIFERVKKARELAK